MRALALAMALLAAPAAAVDVEAPGAAAWRAKNAVEALPAETRAELRRMYMRYRDEVADKLENGWKAGLLSDAVIEDVDEPFQPARLLEAEERNRSKELSRLKELLAATSQDAAEYPALFKRAEDKKEDLRRARGKAAREKGICRDWSDDVWAVLNAMDLEDWTVEDRRRAARPFHTGAVACAPDENPTVCLVFDPWTEGKPAVYAFPAWDARQPGGRLPAEYFLHGLPEKAP